MALSILILSIVSMISINPVASSGSFQLPSDSVPLLDFVFSRLIDDLVAASNLSTNRKTMYAIFDEIQKQLELLSGSGELIDEISIHHGNKELDPHIASVRSIDDLYDSIEWNLRKNKPDRKELEKLAKKCTDFEYPGGIWSNFRRTDPLTHKNFMDLLIEVRNNASDFLLDNRKETPGKCMLIKQSPQYKIYEVYRKLVVTTVKAYSIRIYSYNLLRKYAFHGFVSAKKWEREAYELTVRQFQKSAVSALATASRDIRSCELLRYQKGQNYIELKWLFNPIVTNEAYLNKDASCWETCDYYQDTTFHQYAPQPLDELNICHGRIYNCFQQTVNSSCPATKKSRRFDGLLPKKMGKTSCSRKNDLSKKVSDGAFDKCDQCICYCDDYNRNDTVRTFSLRAVESDTSKNRVITGMKFAEKNRTIYLKIQEGELGPNGIINKSTVKWQPINEIDYKSPYTFPEEFFTVTYDKKIVNLDTLIVPTGRVLTGITLHALGSRLALKIKSNAFNYSSGILQSGYWQSNAPISREEITMTAPDNPAHMNQTVIDKRQNTYVTFRMTDLEKDAGQTAIPFIDNRPVISNPSVPLSGAGLYYSGQTGYGGFIGLKAVTYDFSKVMGN